MATEFPAVPFPDQTAAVEAKLEELKAGITSRLSLPAGLQNFVH